MNWKIIAFLTIAIGMLITLVSILKGNIGWSCIGLVVILIGMIIGSKLAKIKFKSSRDRGHRTHSKTF